MQNYLQKCLFLHHTNRERHELLLLLTLSLLPLPLITPNLASQLLRRYCTFVPPLLLLMTHHEKMRLKALP